MKIVRRLALVVATVAMTAGLVAAGVAPADAGPQRPTHDSSWPY